MLRGLRLRILLVSACGVLGCGEDEAEPTPSSPSNQRGVKPFDRGPEATAQIAPTGVTVQPLVLPTPTTPSEPAKEKEERDLGAELVSAVGSPAACLKPRLATDAPKALVISLDAVVTETGIVTRGSVSGAGLEASELECVRTRMLAVRLRGPIEQAPRGVHGSVTLDLQPVPKAEPAAPVAPTPP